MKDGAASPWHIVAAATAAVMLVVTAFFAAGPSRFHVAGGVDAPAGLERAVSFTSQGTMILRLEVLVDQAFRTAYGPDWAGAAWATVHGAAPLMSDVGIELRIVSIKGIDIAPAATPGLARQAVHERSRDDSLVVALTAYDDGLETDGWGVPGTVASLRVTEGNWANRSSLVAHELGHVLGVNHHPQGHPCSEGRLCVMAEQGYSGADRWCDEHMLVVASILGQLEGLPV